MSQAAVPRLYAMEEQVKLLVNNQFLSDVTFLVGAKKIKIHGHRNILALGSPIFRQHFYGESRLTDLAKPIDVPDQDASGFLNVMKYIYGYNFSDFEFNELYVSYLAAEKYLVKDFKIRMLAYIDSILSNQNCCIIFDQLLKIQKESMMPRKLITLIQVNTEQAFQSDSFPQIDCDTLIYFLKMKFLNIDELSLYKICTRWINTQLINLKMETSIENRRQMFSKIKEYINFSEIDIKQIGVLNKSNNLFTFEELGILFSGSIHVEKKFVLFTTKTDRKRLPNYLTYNQLTRVPHEVREQRKIAFSINLEVNAKVFITSIDTLLLEHDVEKLNLQISVDKVNLFKIKRKFVAVGPKIVVIFIDLFELEPNKKYNFILFIDNYNSASLSKGGTLKAKCTSDHKFEFKSIYSS